jgi:hypothetical protein
VLTVSIQEIFNIAHKSIFKIPSIFPLLGDSIQQLFAMLLIAIPSVGFAALKREIVLLNGIAMVRPAGFEPAAFSSGG